MGALLETAPSKGSTNQSVLGSEEMASAFLASRFQERGVFSQVSVPGRLGIDNAVCSPASVDARRRRPQAYLTLRDIMFLPSPWTTPGQVSDWRLFVAAPPSYLSGTGPAKNAIEERSPSPSTGPRCELPLRAPRFSPTSCPSAGTPLTPATIDGLAISRCLVRRVRPLGHPGRPRRLR